MDRVTISSLLEKTARGEKITMLTAYDYPIAKLLDEAGVDVVLVGDSLGMVVLGQPGTTAVTMEQMLHHAAAVRRGISRALFVGDMPALAFHASTEETVRNADRFVQEAGCDAVKLEWKPGIEAIAQAIVAAGIPVMGHVGLTPQTAAGEGGFGMRGKTGEAAARIVAQALALEAAGCFAMVLECLPDAVAQEITARLRIPTIGIGSGPACDGQVLVTYDLLGLFDRFTPRFVKRYADLASTIREATAAYVEDVRTGRFPATAQTVMMAPDELIKFRQILGAS